MVLRLPYVLRQVVRPASRLSLPSMRNAGSRRYATYPTMATKTEQSCMTRRANVRNLVDGQSTIPATVLLFLSIRAISDACHRFRWFFDLAIQSDWVDAPTTDFRPRFRHAPKPVACIGFSEGLLLRLSKSRKATAVRGRCHFGHLSENTRAEEERRDHYVRYVG